MRMSRPKSPAPFVLLAATLALLSSMPSAALCQELELLPDEAVVTQHTTTIDGETVRYTAEGTAVSISIESQRDGKAILIRVRDHGPGGPEPELDRLFEVFYRVAETRDSTAGSGLGLAIANQAVLAHGGWVTMSTAKAIKTGLSHFGLPGTIYRKKGSMFYELNGKTWEVMAELK